MPTAVASLLLDGMGEADGDAHQRDHHTGVEPPTGGPVLGCRPASPSPPHRRRGGEPLAGPRGGARPLTRRPDPGHRPRDLEPAPGLPRRRAAAPSRRAWDVAATARGQSRPAHGRGIGRKRRPVRPAAPRGRRRARPRSPARRARGGGGGWIRAFVCVPIRARQRLLGTLSLGRQTGSRFTDAELSLLECVADRSGSRWTMRACTRRRGTS